MAICGAPHGALNATSAHCAASSLRSGTPRAAARASRRPPSRRSGFGCGRRSSKDAAAPSKTKPAQGCRRAPIKNRRPQAAMSVIVKICGLSTPEALDVALDAGADMVGFVFFPPSPRHVAFKTAAALESRVRGKAKKVALTVDADDTLLSYVVDALGPDILQLHGD